MPFWATGTFRWFVIAVFVSAAGVLMVRFELMPRLESRRKRVTPPPPSIPAQERQVRFDGVLTTVKDGTPIDMAERAYSYLVRHLETTDAAALAKNAKEVSYVHFANQPDDLRGEPVVVQGLVADSYPLRLDPQVGAREWVYRVLLVDPNGDEGYFFDLLDQPAQFAPRTLVQVEGLFVKNATYEAKLGERTAPFFMGRRMFEAPRVATARPEMWAWGIGIGAPVILLFLLVSLRTSRRARRNDVSSLPVQKES